MKRIFCFLIITLCVVLKIWCFSNLLPKPQNIKYLQGKSFIINDAKIYTDDNSVLEWKKWINENSKFKNPSQVGKIYISLTDTIVGVYQNKDEAYYLKVLENCIYVKAITKTGIYRALQTLRQLSYKKGMLNFIPQCEITDWPAFRVRGFMLDVARTFVSIDELKRIIDLLSLYKINVFHWHLTENIAWRLESKIYPNINAFDNMTRMPGKYYTQEQAKELVEYCKQRCVTLIPEIDMPGHSGAFVRAFNCDMQSEKGMKILKELIDEACDVFDVPYLHIGTDEVKFTNPNFVPDMISFIRSKGKKVISWNPGFKYKKGEIDMIQLWSYGGKAQEGIPAIDCRFHYLNHYDNYADLVSLFNSRVYNSSIGSSDLAGSILAIWNDRNLLNEKQMIAENNFYPNMLVLAERTWRGGGDCYFDGKGTLLWDDNVRLKKDFVEFENRMLWHKKNIFVNEPFPYVKQSNVHWRITDAFPNKGDLKASFPPEYEEHNKYIFEGKTYNTRTISGAGIYLRHVWGDLVPGFYDNPTENSTAYAYTWVYSDKTQKAGLILEFHNYSRSECDLPPRQGTWDYKGSRAWLNGKEIIPPKWNDINNIKSLEDPLTNENSSSRPPIQIELKKGWNKILLKLPVGKFHTKETRLVKWMFNAVLVTIDGRNELENIVYSTDKVLH